MKLLDRYVLRSFMEPFLICSGGFIAIWLMFDYSDKSNDFIQVHASLKQIAGYYLTQLPAPRARGSAHPRVPTRQHRSEV